MKPRDLETNPWVRFLFYLIILLILRWNSLTAPLIGDSVSYLMPTVFRMLREGLEVWPVGRHFGEGAYGHPFLLFHLLFFLQKVGLPTLASSHTVILLFSAIAVFATDRLSRALAGPGAGLAAGLLLLVTPVFLAQAGLVRLAMPLLAFMILTLWSGVTGRWALCALFGSLAVLTKEPGVWMLPPLGLYALFSSPRKQALKRAVYVSVPGVVFLLWMAGGRLVTGRWINRPNVRWDYLGPMRRVSELFSGDGRYFLAFVLFVSTLWLVWRARSRLRVIFAPLAVVAIWILLPMLKSGTSYPTLALLAASTALGAMMIGTGTLWKGRESVLWGVIMVHLIILASLKETMPRYLLPALAVFIVLAVKAIWRIPLGWVRCLVVVPMIVLSVSEWNRGNEWFGNLQYEEDIRVTEEFARRMEAQLIGEKILFDGPGHIYADPRYGYVKKPLDLYGGKGERSLPEGTLPDIVITTISTPGIRHRAKVEREYILRLERRWRRKLRPEIEVESYRFRGRAYRVSIRKKHRGKAG